METLSPHSPDDTALAPPPSRGSTLATASVGRDGIQIGDFAQLSAFSKHVFDSGLIDKRSFPNPQAVFVAIETGMELGLKPLQALRGVFVVNNKASLMGDTALAVVRRSSVCEYVKSWEHGEGDDYGWTVEAKRRGEDPVKRTYTVQDAKVAGLWGKTTSSGGDTPWTTNPRRMIYYRALGYALRDAFSDVLLGLHVYEELVGREPEQPAENSSGTQSLVQRRRAARAADDVVAVVAGTPVEQAGSPEPANPWVEFPQDGPAATVANPSAAQAVAGEPNPPAAPPIAATAPTPPDPRVPTPGRKRTLKPHSPPPSPSPTAAASQAPPSAPARNLDAIATPSGLTERQAMNIARGKPKDDPLPSELAGVPKPATTAPAAPLPGVFTWTAGEDPAETAKRIRTYGEFAYALQCHAKESGRDIRKIEGGVNACLGRWKLLTTPKENLRPIDLVRMYAAIATGKMDLKTGEIKAG